MENFFDQHNEPLGQRIAFAFERLSTALRHNAWQEATPRRLTPTQGEILTLLERRPGVPLKEVAELIGVRPATASEAVRVLVEKGWVEKSRHPEDRRALWLRLTPDGRDLARGAASWTDFLARAVEGLQEDEGEVLLRSLMHLIERLQVEGRIPSARMCSTCRYFRPHRHDDSNKPHHCAFVDAPFGDRDLRFDCADHTTS